MHQSRIHAQVRSHYLAYSGPLQEWPFATIVVVIRQACDCLHPSQAVP